jgi:hypothetical protein
MHDNPKEMDSEKNGVTNRKNKEINTKNGRLN